jgi:TetR/AcrR family transcriptional regulator, cholesterol catabolism regulator
VPQTRSAVSREEKESEILALAVESLRDGGYERLSMARIARELGLAQNAVYWYFPSRDHLFVAALQQMMEAILERKPRRETADEVERVLWFTEQFREVSALRGVMTERARASDVVREFATNLDALLSRMLSNTIRGLVPPEELPLVVSAFRAVADGTLTAGLSRARRREVLEFTLRRLLRGNS